MTSADCCQVCAKVEGEVCGFLWGYCDQDLFCDIAGDKPWRFLLRGKCQRKKTTTTTPTTTTSFWKGHLGPNCVGDGHNYQGNY